MAEDVISEEQLRDLGIIMVGTYGDGEVTGFSRCQFCCIATDVAAIKGFSPTLSVSGRCKYFKCILCKQARMYSAKHKECISSLIAVLDMRDIHA